MTAAYVDPDVVAATPGRQTRPSSALAGWWTRRVWAFEHAFEQSKARNRAVDDAQLRIFFVLVAFGLAFVGLGLGAARAALLSEAAQARRAAPIAAPARADLVDRNGLPLAMDIEHWGVYLDPLEVWDSVETRAKLLAVAPNLQRSRLELAFQRGKRTFIVGGLTPAEKAKVLDLGLPGVTFEPEPGRVYPLGAQAAHLVGFTRPDTGGVAGAEKALNKEILQAGKGGAVPLALDLRIQAALEEELAYAAVDQRAIGAMGVVADTRTGEILAMASWPDFDPNRPGQAAPEALMNRAAAMRYEMGSTFKGLTIAAGLEAGVVKRGDMFDATKPLKIGSRTVRDFHATHRVLSLDEVFTKSSNIGTSRIALAMGPQTFSTTLDRWGLLSRPEIELPEAAGPLKPRKWDESTLASVSFGHGLAVSPLALVEAMLPMGNGGLRVPLTIKKRDGRPAEARRVMTEETSQAMLKLMRLNVIAGSGKRADAPGLRVGGKTGTGEKAFPGRGYDSTKNISSFAAIFPTDGPPQAQRYMVLVLMDEPKGGLIEGGGRTGATAAAPAVGKVADRVAPFLNLIRREKLDVELEVAALQPEGALPLPAVEAGE